MGEEFYRLFVIQRSLIMFSQSYDIENQMLKNYIEKYSMIKTSNRKNRKNLEVKVWKKFELAKNDTGFLLNFSPSVVFRPYEPLESFFVRN
jgi:hypothetical protein